MEKVSSAIGDLFWTHLEALESDMLKSESQPHLL